MTPFTGVQKLRLNFLGLLIPTQWENGEIDGTTWHELLMSFMGVTELRICPALSQELSRALQVNEIGSDPVFLPGLQEIQFHEMKADNLFGSFIYARQVAGRPVSLFPQPPITIRTTRRPSIHPGEYI